MSTPQGAGEQRFHDAARAAGLDVEVVRFPEGAHTAAAAAAAIGCEVAAIVKSLVFADGDRAVLVLTSGANRVDTAKAGAALGLAALRRADADLVRRSTGYAIGGVAPLGHDGDVPVLVDRDLFAFDEVWAAAGSPATVFRTTPADLVTATDGIVADVAAS